MVKRGQLKIQQMAFMLIAVTLFLVFVALFIIGFKFASLREGATELNEKNSMLLASKIANSPEFACGEAYGTRRTNCIDLDKAMVLSQNSLKYKDYWGVAGITIIRIFPRFDNRKCTLGSYPSCSLLDVYDSGKNKGADYSNFVILCRKDKEQEDKCELGKILVYPEEIN